MQYLRIPFSYPQTIDKGTLAQTEIEMMKGDTNAITWNTPATISADASGSGAGSTLQYQWVECDADGTEKAESSYSQTAASETPTFDLATLPAGEYDFFCKLTASDPLDAEAKKSEPVHVTVYDITGVPAYKMLETAGDTEITLPEKAVAIAGTEKPITWAFKDVAGVLQDNNGKASLNGSVLTNNVVGQVTLVATINGTDITKEFTIHFCDHEITVNSITDSPVEMMAGDDKNLTVEATLAPQDAAMSYEWFRYGAGIEKEDAEIVSEASSDAGANILNLSEVYTGEYYYFCRITADNAEPKESEPVYVVVYDITDVPEIEIAGSLRSLGGTVSPAESGKSITWSIKAGAGNNTAGVTFTNTTNTEIYRQQPRAHKGIHD